MGWFRTWTRPQSRKAAVVLATGSIVAVSAFGVAGAAHAGPGVTADDSRATTGNGNINACPAGQPALVVGGTSTKTQNGVTVTVSHLASAEPNPYPAGGWTTLPKGTAVLTITLPAGDTFSGTTYVKGGNGYNIYPPSAVTGLIPPVNNGNQIAGLSHFLVCGTLQGQVGSVKVTKQVTGTPPANLGSFGITLTCGGDETDMSLGDGDSQTVNSIGDGTSCTVTEPDNKGASSTTYTVDNGSPGASASFDVSTGHETDVTVTNHYEPATLTVKKVTTGTSPATGPFSVKVDCGGNNTYTFQLNSGDSHDVTPLAGGSTCKVTETDTDGATSTTYTVDSGSPSGSAPSVDLAVGQTRTVTITNDYASPGGPTLTVKKVVTGNQTSDGPFSVEVVCGSDQEVPSTAHRGHLFVVQNTYDFTLDAGDSHDITGLDENEQCTVTETDADGADSTTYTVNDGDPQSDPPTVMVSSDELTTVTITNDFEAATPPPTTPPPPTATLKITKAVTGTDPSNGPFSVDADCGPAGTSDFQLDAGDSQTMAGLPDGASCTVTETDAGGATSTTYTVDAGSPVTDPPTVQVSAAQETDVTITNDFEPAPPAEDGTLAIHKSVDKDVADYGDLLHYTLHVSAAIADQHDVVVTDDVPAHTTFVSASCAAPCTVSGPTDGTVTWNVGTLTAGSSIDLAMTVQIDEPSGDTAPAETIVNVAVAGSQEDPIVESNPVKTKVNQVLGEHVTRHHHHKKPAVKAVHHTNSGSTLPFTGLAARSLGGLALALIGLGVVLELTARRRRRT